MGDVIDLTAESARLLEEAKRSSAGRASASLLHGDHQRAVLIALNGGSSLSEHESPLSATLQTLVGSCTVVAGEDQWPVGEGEMVTIPQARHSVESTTDCVFLLTVSL